MLLIAGPAVAQDYMTDAFGVMPKNGASSPRMNWSDVQSKGQNAQTILAFVGPKSLTAGKDVGHAVAVLFDRYGNLVGNGEQAVFKIGPTTHSTQTLNGLAEIYFVPKPLAGKFEVAIASGQSQSARAIYRVTADLESLLPAIATQTPTLKPETFAEFATESLIDKFGNTAPSGVGGQLVLAHPDGSVSFATPNVQNGKLKTHFLIRDIPNGGALYATVAGQHSNQTSVDITPMALAHATEIQLKAIPSIQAVSLRAGPVMTDAGHVLNDGANVTLSIRGDSGREVTQTGWLRDGFIDLVLPIEPSDLPFVVLFSTTLGDEKTVFSTIGPLSEQPLVGPN